MRRHGGSERLVKSRRANRPKAPKVSTTAPSITDLQKQVASLTRDLTEALERQTATAEILQVINSSPGNLAPVFAAMLEKATRLCGAKFGILWLYDGDRFTGAATHAVPAALAEFVREPLPVAASGMMLDIVRGQNLVHIPDMAATELYHAGHRGRGALVDLGGARTLISVALRKDKALLGVFNLYRQEVRPFSVKEIVLVQNFADHAVIAMENVRLLTEQREALERQTATAEVLQVINSSPGELAPVFQAMLEKAHNLCGVSHGSLQLYDGEKFRAVAVHGISEAFADRLRQGFVPGPNHPSQPLLKGARFAQVPDCNEVDDPVVRAAFELAGIRTVLFIPLRKDGSLLGQIAAARREARPFTEKEIALLESFAAQAVIAMENARLLGELRQRTADLSESLQQQTATSDVLKTISRSTTDLETVLDTLVETVARLCRAEQAVMFRRLDDRYHVVASCGLPSEAKDFLLSHPLATNRGTLSGRVELERRPIQIGDVLQDPEYAYLEGQRIQGYRTMLGVPLLRQDSFVGIFIINRTRVEPFTDKEIELATTFADQAVIAIENARLFEELRDRQTELARSVDELTATGDVLKIISRSTVDLATVLDTLVETVARLCRTDQTLMFRRRDDKYHLVAARGLSEEAKVFIHTHPLTLDRGTVSGRVALERRTVHIPDILQDPEYSYAGAKVTGVRTILGVPLLREEVLVGIFTVHRTRVDPFTDKEIELVTTFADQAVIAIENARLFEELRQSLQQQMATADVLKVISRSAFDLGSVLQTLVESAARLCDADKANITRQTGEVFYRAEFCGFTREFMDHLRRIPIKPERGSASGRALLERRAVHILDVLSDPEYTLAEEANWGGFRTALAVPILREGVPIGVLNLTRAEMRPFADKQIELVSTFADQAAIAIENARLVAELRERQAELRVTFDNMGDGVVMFGADTRLVAWNRNFQTILDLPDELLAQRPTYVDYVHILAERGEFGNYIEAELSRRLQDTNEELRLERTRPDGRVIEVRRNPVPGGGFVLIYADITERKRAEEAIRAARDAAETALRDLQAAQASLVHAQKMAALGQLTAGIAHEIKNPLNFVNNFAGLSVELLEELKGATAEAVGALHSGKRAEILETIGMLTGNLEKIAEHGRRADGIVRGMLQHSRGGSGDWQSTDLNALVEESVNLAYHGARAQDQDFGVALELDLDRNLAPIEVVSQDVNRVLLNLLTNGFYAVTKRSREGNGAFRPTLQIATREFGEGVEVRVRDNGVGIPAEDYERLFQPFFTTKPTGEGTGLGLSISYEIITLQHGGSITVESEVGDFTEFTVRLPRRRHAVAG